LAVICKANILTTPFVLGGQIKRRSDQSDLTGWFFVCLNARIMKKPILTILFILLLTISAFAQIPKVYVAPMENNFHDFVTAALLSNQVPVSIVTDDAQADFIIAGGSVKGQNKWYDTTFGIERDRNQGSIRLLRVSDKTVAWAGAAGDRSIWWGALKSGGLKKVANRLARKLKKEFFDGTPRLVNPIYTVKPKVVEN
jgi:hypothetical protein